MCGQLCGEHVCVVAWLAEWDEVLVSCASPVGRRGTPFGAPCTGGARCRAARLRVLACVVSPVSHWLGCRLWVSFGCVLWPVFVGQAQYGAWVKVATSKDIACSCAWRIAANCLPTGLMTTREIFCQNRSASFVRAHPRLLPKANFKSRKASLRASGPSLPRE